MSASGYKQTSRGSHQNVRFTPVSGHRRFKNTLDSKSGHPMSALPPIADIRIAIPYQPLTNVCCTPNSGRSRGYRRMSAFDPKRT